MGQVVGWRGWMGPGGVKPFVTPLFDHVIITTYSNVIPLSDSFCNGFRLLAE